MNKGANLSDKDHVIRYVPWTRLRRDENDKVIGFLGQAFELRPDEAELSVNWLEYFVGDKKQQVEESIRVLRKSRKVGSKSAYGIGNVGKVKSICAAAGSDVRIVYDPEKDNPAHSVIRRLPRDELGLFETLATDAFTELVPNSALG